MFRLSCYNIANGGEDYYNPSKIIFNILQQQADIICIQEFFTDQVFVSQLEDQLLRRSIGYRSTIAPSSCSFQNVNYSRYPAVKIENFVIYQIPDNELIAVANCHFDDCPYQPFQYYGIPYCDAPSSQDYQQLYQYSRKSREKCISHLSEQIDTIKKITNKIIVCGDFNEPEGFFVTDSLKRWGISDLLAGCGNRQNTWDHPQYPARIDYIWGLNVTGSNPQVGRSWPSDHHIISIDISS